MLPLYILLTVIVLLLIINLVLSYKATQNKSADLFYKLNGLSSEILRIEAAVKTEIAGNRKETFDNATTSRKELAGSLEAFKKDLAQTIQQFNTIQKDNFYALLNKQTEQNTDTGNRLDSMRQTLEKR